MVSIKNITINALLIASIVAQSSNSSSPSESSSSKSPETSATLNERDKCLINCGAGNVACQAKCDNLPNPSEDDVKKSTLCISNCHNNTEINQDAKKLATCLEQCAPTTPSGSSGSSGSSESSGSDSPKPSGSNSKGQSGGSAKSGDAKNSSNASTLFLSTSFLVALGITAFY